MANVSTFEDKVLGALDAIVGRIEALESKPQAPKQAVSATPTQVSGVPESPELATLRDACNPAAARIVRSHAKKGVGDMILYVDKLAEFQANPERPSTRFQYASALLSAMQKQAEVKPAWTPDKRTAELLARASEPAPAKRGRKAQSVAVGHGKRVKEPSADADLSVWRDFIKATQDTSGISAAGIRTRAWRAKERALGHDPYREAVS